MLWRKPDARCRGASAARLTFAAALAAQRPSLPERIKLFHALLFQMPLAAGKRTGYDQMWNHLCRFPQ